MQGCRWARPMTQADLLLQGGLGERCGSKGLQGEPGRRGWEQEQGLRVGPQRPPALQIVPCVRLSRSL